MGRDYNFLSMKRGKSGRVFFILAAVTVLYILYHYEGSADFYLKYFNKSTSFLKAQAASVYYQRSLALFLLGIIPMIIIRVGFKERLIDYGFKLPEGLLSLFVILLGILIVTPLVYFGAKRPEFIEIYPAVENARSGVNGFIVSSVFYFFYYVGYEFCFRGFLLFGIRDAYGDVPAIAVSLALTTILHITQPQSETLMALVAGLIFPILVFRFRSIIPSLLIHAYVGIALDYWIIMGGGGFGF